MRKLLSLFLLIGFVYIAYGLYISIWRPGIFSILPAEIRTSIFYDYPGAINIRTNQSSGSGQFDSVIASARKSNLSFIIITDLNDFNPNLARAAYFDNVLTLAGGEYSYQNARLLNLDIKTNSHLQGPGRSQILFAELLNNQNITQPEGSFVLAHPFKPGYELTGPYPTGLNGIEIINLKSVWQDSWIKSKSSFFWTALVYPFNSNLAFLRLLSQAGSREIQLWDKLTLQQKIYGVYGSAAEAKFKITDNIFINFPSYETVLSIVRNHVLIRSELTGNGELDQKKIADALRRGQFYLSLDLLESPIGFECYAKDNKNQIHPLGSELKFATGLTYNIDLPAKPNIPFEVIIFQDGKKIMTSNSLSTIYALQGPGVYRSVVRVRVPMPPPDGKTWMNWIVTNPIYIR